MKRTRLLAQGSRNDCHFLLLFFRLNSSYNHFVPSQIRPVLFDSELSFHISRYPSFASEADVLSICGLTLSLVVVPARRLLPPLVLRRGRGGQAPATAALAGSTSRAAAASSNARVSPVPPGVPYPCSWDCHEGLVRSGNDGAVFIRGDRRI